MEATTVPNLMSRLDAADVVIVHCPNGDFKVLRGAELAERAVKAGTSGDLKYVNMNVNSYAQADQLLEVMRLLNDGMKDDAMALMIIIVAAARASRARPN